MRAPSAFLRSLPLLRIQPRTTVALAPLAVKSPFNERLTAELHTLQSQRPHDEPKFTSVSGLIQLLDASIAAQRIALDIFVKIPHRDLSSDRRALDEYGIPRKQCRNSRCLQLICRENRDD